MSAPALAPPKTKSQALRSYDVADFPALTGREEEWRFTPLARLRALDAEGSVPAPKAEYGELPAGVTVSTVDSSDGRIGSVLTPFDRLSALAFGRAGEALLVSVARGAVLAVAAPIREWGKGAYGPALRAL